MEVSQTMSTEIASARRLLSRVTCPHCWEQFPPEASLWIAEHGDLLGDGRLGPDEPERFLPTRFTPSGEALDARGFPCHQLACPKCHLTVPRALLEIEPLFLSIFGAPASGKSYFLAAMTWELRQILGLRFGLTFSDADPVMNRHLNEYEQSLFENADSESQVPLAHLIRKTEEQGDLYDTVSYGTQTVSYPRPCLFTMQPAGGHPNEERAAQLARVLCLYDNAGESFQPGKDNASSPVTRHMARSRALFYVFDPTQDQRFRRACGHAGGADATASRQEPLLHEAASRIRRYAGLRQTEKHNRPLVVILTKFDVWSELLEDSPGGEPWREVSGGRTRAGHSSLAIHAIDQQQVEDRSRRTRKLLGQLCPEIVSAAEGFARDVVFVPVSAVGWNTGVDQSSGQLTIRPGEARPHWVTIPFLYALSRWTPGLIPVVRQRKRSNGRARRN